MKESEIRVRALSSTPVKGLRILGRRQVMLERGGIRGDRALDARRFRMSIELSGAAAHEEDDWIGREIAVGEARIRLTGHVGRCIITSRHPETGDVDVPTLDLLRDYRGDAQTTEPLAFG